MDSLLCIFSTHSANSEMTNFLIIVQGSIPLHIAAIQDNVSTLAVLVFMGNADLKQLIIVRRIIRDSFMRVRCSNYSMEDIIMMRRAI